MPFDREPPRISPLRSEAEEVRRRVVEASHESGFSGGLSDHAAMDLYLALLQDRLPVYVRVVAGLAGGGGVGRASVEDNLGLVGRAAIDFYGEVLAAKVSVFIDPAQLARLRKVLRANELGPDRAIEGVGAYLRSEQELGRVAADVDCLAIARLLLGGCLNFVFTEMLMGEADGPPAGEYVAELVQALRLAP